KIDTEMMIYFNDRTGAEQIQNISNIGAMFDFIIYVDASFSLRFSKQVYFSALREYGMTLPIVGSIEATICRPGATGMRTLIAPENSTTQEMGEILHRKQGKKMEIVSWSDFPNRIKNLREYEELAVYLE